MEGLKFSKTHEWVKFEGDTAIVGISDFAQNAMGDIVFADLPEAGDEVTAGEAFGEIESVKAVSDVNSPVSGRIAEINVDLLDSPEMINEAPYDAWYIRVVDVTDHLPDLMGSDEYATFCESEQ